MTTPNIEQITEDLRLLTAPFLNSPRFGTLQLLPTFPEVSEQRVIWESSHTHGSGNLQFLAAVYLPEQGLWLNYQGSAPFSDAYRPSTTPAQSHEVRYGDKDRVLARYLNSIRELPKQRQIPYSGSDLERQLRT